MSDIYVYGATATTPIESSGQAAVEASFIATQIGGYREAGSAGAAVWRYPNERIHQGEWSDQGDNTGCMWWNNATLRASVGTKIIKSATLTMHRNSGAGRDFALPVKLWSLTTESANGTTPPAGAVVRGVFRGEIGFWSRGQTKTVPIPVAAITEMLSGTGNKGLCIYDVSNNYLYFDTMPTLTLTFEEPLDENVSDYSNMGLVGALVPTECVFTETANGESVLTLKHPLDEFGRYEALRKGNIIVAQVPVRTTPEIQNGSCVTTVWSYQVKALNLLTSKNQRTLYKKVTGSSRMKYLNAGDIVTVVQKPEGEDSRWKAKTQYGTGWIDPTGFTLITEHIIENSSTAIEEIQSPWSMTDQYFRIYEETKTLTDISVTARHIRYDLLKNTTRYSSETAVTLQTALDGVLNNCYAPHDFTAYTNVTNEVPGLFYKRKNPIYAFLDPEEGICTKFNVGMVTDNYSLYFLHDPGVNRGVTVEYQKNMTGIEFTSSDDEVATRIIPVGETKDGKDLLLSDTVTQQYIDSPNINVYPIIHTYELVCDNCKVGDKDDQGGTITIEVARSRMRQQADDLIKNGCDNPKITMAVQFANLGDTEEYAQFKNLEDCFLFDYITVRHPDLNIDVTAQIVSITWDCLIDRMKDVTIGTVGENLSNQGITSWQIPSGFNGSKIGSGTLGNASLKGDIIAARHVQSDSINTEALQAGAITTKQLNTEIVNTAIANIAKAKIGEAVIGAAQIDFASIADANILFAYVKSANIDEIDAEKIKTGILSVERLELVGSETSIMFTINDFNGETMPSSVKWQGVSIEENTLTVNHVKPSFGGDLDLSNNNTVMSLKNDSATITSALIRFRSADMMWEFLDPSDLEKVLLRMSANGNAGFMDLYAERVHASNVVNVTSGFSKDISNIAEAIEAIPKMIDGQVTLYLQNDYTGNITIEGYHGGHLILDLGMHTVFGTIFIRNSSCITIQDGSFADTRTGSLGTWGYTALVTWGSTVTFDNVRFDTKDCRDNCMVVSVDSTVYVRGCDFKGANNGVYIETGAKGSLYNNRGNLAQRGIIATNGGFFSCGGSIPIGALSNLHKLNGGEYIGTGTGLTTAQGAPPSVPTTSTFIATQIARWNVDSTPSWRDSGVKYHQGMYSSAAGYNVGCIWFDLTAMRAAIGSKTIQSVTITMRRYKGAGDSAALPVFLYGLKNRTGPSGTLSITNDIGLNYGDITVSGKTAKSIGSWPWPTAGEAKTVSVPMQAVIDMLDVSKNIYGLCIYDGNDTDNYMYFDTKPTLTVVSV